MGGITPADLEACTVGQIAALWAVVNARAKLHTTD